jgi:2-methylaconitate cis-trans-isomerase PrpF
VRPAASQPPKYRELPPLLLLLLLQLHYRANSNCQVASHISVLRAHLKMNSCLNRSKPATAAPAIATTAAAAAAVQLQTAPTVGLTSHISVLLAHSR